MSDSDEEWQSISLKEKHSRGYEHMPQTAEEIAEWEAEQVWDEYEPEGTE